jgi:hypothetical protein
MHYRHPAPSGASGRFSQKLPLEARLANDACWSRAAASEIDVFWDEVAVRLPISDGSPCQKMVYRGGCISYGG